MFQARRATEGRQQRSQPKRQRTRRCISLHLPSAGLVTPFLGTIFLWPSHSRLGPLASLVISRRLMNQLRPFFTTHNASPASRTDAQQLATSSVPLPAQTLNTNPILQSYSGTAPLLTLCYLCLQVKPLKSFKGIFVKQFKQSICRFKCTLLLLPLFHFTAQKHLLHFLKAKGFSCLPLTSSYSSSQHVSLPGSSHWWPLLDTYVTPDINSSEKNHCTDTYRHI